MAMNSVIMQVVRQLNLRQEADFVGVKLSQKDNGLIKSFVLSLTEFILLE